MKKKDLTEDFIRDYWLKKGHNIDTAWLVENEHDLIQTSDWYKKYAVSQELHDEWHKWAIETIAKTYKISKKSAAKGFVWHYLNLAPNVIEPTKDNHKPINK